MKFFSFKIMLFSDCWREKSDFFQGASNWSSDERAVPKGAGVSTIHTTD